MSANQGLEGIAVLRAGPLKGIARRLRGAVHARQRLSHRLDLDRRRAAGASSCATSTDFDITGAAALPDGGLLVLERRFRWTEGVKMRMRSSRPQRDQARRTPRRPTFWSQADGGLEIDNMEGIAVHRGRGGETIVTLMSDDNFNSLLQRTICCCSSRSAAGAHLASIRRRLDRPTQP